MIHEQERAQILDEEHLRLLSLAFLVAGGVHAAFCFFPLIYVAMGAMIWVSPDPAFSNPSGPEARFLGGIFMAIGLVLFALIAVFAAAQLFSGYCIRKRKHRIFVLITSGISCLMVPYGTMLGVSGIIVLQRPTVVKMFQEADVNADTNSPPGLNAS